MSGEIISRYFYSTINEKQKKLFDIGLSEQRYLYYNSLFINTFLETSIAESEEKIYYSYTNKKIMFNVNSGFFVKIYDKCGFTFNKETKKLKSWFGKPVTHYAHSFDSIFTSLGLEWVKPVYYDLINRLTLEKILAKKITNPKELVRHYLNNTKKLKKLNLSYKHYDKIINHLNSGNAGGLSLFIINRGITVAKDGNNYLKYLVNNIDEKNKILLDSIYKDMINQALILDDKIDFNWSKKRIEQVHTDWTIKLMKFKADKLSNTVINYEGLADLKIPYDGKLIQTEKELYVEGEVQKHCVYTNYWSTVNRMMYFVVTINAPERITIGIDKSFIGDQFKISQIYGFKNKIVNRNIREEIVDWLDEENVQDFFKLNYKKKINVESTSLLSESVDLAF